jgi:hypothetical protein
MRFLALCVVYLNGPAEIRQYVRQQGASLSVCFRQRERDKHADEERGKETWPVYTDRESDVDQIPWINYTGDPGGFCLG